MDTQAPPRDEDFTKIRVLDVKIKSMNQSNTTEVSSSSNNGPKSAKNVSESNTRSSTPSNPPSTAKSTDSTSSNTKLSKKSEFIGLKDIDNAPGTKLSSRQEPEPVIQEVNPSEKSRSVKFNLGNNTSKTIGGKASKPSKRVRKKRPQHKKIAPKKSLLKKVKNSNQEIEIKNRDQQDMITDEEHFKQFEPKQEPFQPFDKKQTDSLESNLAKKQKKIMEQCAPVEEEVTEKIIKSSKNKVIVLVEDEQEIRIQKAIKKVLGDYLDDLSGVETASDFNKLWKGLKNDETGQKYILGKILPAQMAKICKNGLDFDLFNSILHGFR